MPFVWRKFTACRDCKIFATAIYLHLRERGHENGLRNVSPPGTPRNARQGGSPAHSRGKPDPAFPEGDPGGGPRPPAPRGGGEARPFRAEGPIPLPPGEIRERTPEPKPDASTIYRNLSLMVSIGLVRSVALPARRPRHAARRFGKRVFVDIFLMIFLLLSPFPAGAGELRVLASFLPMYLFTRNVVGAVPGVALDRPL